MSQSSSWGGSEKRIGVTKQDRAAIAQAVIAAMVEDPTGGIRAAAKAVGVSKSSLYRLMNEYAEVGDQIRAAQVCFRGAGQMLRELVGDDDDLIPHGREIHAPLSIYGRRAALENMQAREQADQARADREVGTSQTVSPKKPDQTDTGSHILSEENLKRSLVTWLERSGWETEVAWGKARGPDIVATRASDRWVIEVKGIGSRSAMRVNYFIGILGETLQRMDDSAARYSIALPDAVQFQRLWDRLPALAKARTQISVLFVNEEGDVRELRK